MCDCKNVKIGGYANITTLKAPIWSSKDTIDLDTCIVFEIKELWAMGVVTYGSCCGHNKNESFVNVSEKDIPKMIQLGYISNHKDPSRVDTFRLKSAG